MVHLYQHIVGYAAQQPSDLSTLQKKVCFLLVKHFYCDSTATLLHIFSSQFHACKAVEYFWSCGRERVHIQCTDSQSLRRPISLLPTFHWLNCRERHHGGCYRMNMGWAGISPPKPPSNIFSFFSESPETKGPLLIYFVMLVEQNIYEYRQCVCVCTCVHVYPCVCIHIYECMLM